MADRTVLLLFYYTQRAFDLATLALELFVKGMFNILVKNLLSLKLEELLSSNICHINLRPVPDFTA
jgi:hypothetical protein